MADTIAPTGVNPKDTAFATPEAFKQAGGAADFSNVKSITPGSAVDAGSQFYKFNNNDTVFQNSAYVPVGANPGTQNTSTNLGEEPVTNNDLNSLLAENAKLQQQVLAATKPTADEQVAQQKYNTLQTQGEQLQTDVNDQIMRLGVQPGVSTGVASAQQAEASRQGQYRIQTNAIQQNAAARGLQALQSTRQATLQAYQLATQFGTQNAQMAFQLQQATKAEAAAATKLALDYGITKPFYQFGGEIRRTSDGKRYSTPEEFFKDAGVKDFGEAQAKGLVQENIKKPSDLSFGVIGETTDEYGNTTKQYGTFDPLTGKVTPSGTFPSTGNGSGDGSTPSGDMRTDRNNNPTAMTTDVAKSLGLVEGVDYTQGDSFKDEKGNTLYTAKLLGNPIDTTVKALDTAARTSDKTDNAFYTGSGKQRWSHTAMKDSEWLAKTPEQKAQTIAQMYHNEGGSGVLLTSAGTTQPLDKSAYQQAFKNAVATGQLTKFAQVTNQKNLNDALAKGDLKSARAILTNSIFAQLPAADRTKLAGRAETLADLNAIQGYLKDYMAKGGDTNLLVGTANDWANKIGKTLGYDAQFIQNTILQTLVNYRKSLTGVAFGPKEAEDYAKLFPDIGKEAKFNAASLEALKSTLERDTGAIIANSIGNEDLYNKIYGEGQVQHQSATAYVNDLNSGTTGQANNSPADSYLDSLGLKNNQPTQNTGSVFSPKSFGDVIKNTGNIFKDTFKSAFGIS